MVDETAATLYKWELDNSDKIISPWGKGEKNANQQMVSNSESLQYHWSCPFVWVSIFRYLYGDLYAGAIWAATENPGNSGSFNASKIPFGCAHDSPIQCNSVPQSTLPALGYLYSFGEDNSKDIFILASNGVYRIVRPSRCNYACSEENVTTFASPGPAAMPRSYASRLSNPYNNLVLLVTSVLLFLLPSV